MFLPLLVLLAASALALDVEHAQLPWSSFGHSAAAEDAQARGPELLHAGPDGRLALYDPVKHQVVLLASGHADVRLPVLFTSDLILLADGVLLLEPSTRRLSLWSPEGRLRSERSLPPLVPTAVTLALEGDQVLAVDIFGQGHPAATLAAGELEAPTLRRLQRRPDAVLWDGRTLSTEGLQLDLTGALKASGQRFGDWLVVDEVRDDQPIAVVRTAWHVPSGQSIELPVDGRLYAPRGDCAAAPDGSLRVLVPGPEALDVLKVTP